MSNTQKRIISALVLMIIVTFSFIMGKKYVLGFLLVVSLLACDEIFCNFFKRKRFSPMYFLNALVLAVPFVYMNFLGNLPELFYIFVNAAIGLNIVLIYYLFFTKIDGTFFQVLSIRFPFLAAILVLLPAMSLTNLFHYSNWYQLIICIMVVNFSMDTGAWLVGKNLGKRKLWEAVSPNKTIEGLLGGIMFSGVLGSAVWNYYFHQVNAKLFFSFCLLGLLSQVGDLVQSKIKRQFGIKDSSRLIPGHGGVYDRIDSLYFVVPFYAAIIKFIYY